MFKKKNVYPYKLNILKKNEEEMKVNGEKNPVKLTSHFLVLSQRMFLFLKNAVRKSRIEYIPLIDKNCIQLSSMKGSLANTIEIIEKLFFANIYIFYYRKKMVFYFKTQSNLILKKLFQYPSTCFYFNCGYMYE